MRVQMKTRIGGFRNGEEWPAPGGVIDVPDAEADSLIANGYARPAPDEPTDEATDIDEEVDDDADQGQAADADGDAPADADGDTDGADDAGAEAPAGDEAAAEPAAAKPRKPAAKRVSAKTQEA